MLKCERFSRNMEIRIRRAFWSYLKVHFANGHPKRKEIRLAYEHGQWWAIWTQRDEDMTFSVVDSEGWEGVHSFDGFGFEAIG